jgi:hypothetical protein
MTDSFSKVSLWSVDFSIFIHESGCKKFPIIISSSTESQWIHYHRREIVTQSEDYVNYFKK